MESTNIISWISFKKFNYINEQCGYTVDGNALMKLNMIYSEYLTNKDCPQKNQMTMDYHCGMESDDTIQGGIDTTNIENKIPKNIKFIKKLIYNKKDTRAGVHRCKYNEFIDLFAKKSKCGNIETNNVLWDEKEHPIIESSGNRVENCGELFRFSEGFDHFVEQLAIKHGIDLNKINDWNVYSSKINQLSTYEDKSITITRKKRKRARINKQNSDSDDEEYKIEDDKYKYSDTDYSDSDYSDSDMNDIDIHIKNKQKQKQKLKNKKVKVKHKKQKKNVNKKKVKKKKSIYKEPVKKKNKKRKRNEVGNDGNNKVLNALDVKRFKGYLGGKCMLGRKSIPKKNNGKIVSKTVPKKNRKKVKVIKDDSVESIELLKKKKVKKGKQVIKKVNDKVNNKCNDDSNNKLNDISSDMIDLSILYPVPLTDMDMRSRVKKKKCKKDEKKDLTKKRKRKKKSKTNDKKQKNKNDS